METIITTISVLFTVATVGVFGVTAFVLLGKFVIGPIIKSIWGD